MKLFWKLCGLALQSLAQHRMRSGLTMLGLIIGVGAVIVMLAIGEGAQRRVSKNIKSLGTNLLIVRPGSSRRGPVRSGNVQTLTLKDAQAIKAQVTNVAAVSPEAGKAAQVKYGAKNTNTSILGCTEDYLGVNNFKLAEGRFIEAADVRKRSKVAVLGATPVKDILEGDGSLLGRTVKIMGINFKVIGILEAKGQSGYRDPDDQVLVPLSTAMRRLFGIDYLRALNVQVSSEAAMGRTQGEIEDLLRQRHRLAPGAPSDFRIRNQKEILDTMSEVASTFTALLAAVAAVAMLIGGIGIMNIMLVSVTERTREIGIRKAVGARRRDILSQFLVEAVVLSLVGGIIGVIGGVGASYLVGMGGSWPTVVKMDSIVMAFSISVATGIFFGLYPARKASRLDPIEALRYE